MGFSLTPWNRTSLFFLKPKTGVLLCQLRNPSILPIHGVDNSQNKYVTSNCNHIWYSYQNQTLQALDQQTFHCIPWASDELWDQIVAAIERLEMWRAEEIEIYQHSCSWDFISRPGEKNIRRLTIFAKFILIFEKWNIKNCRIIITSFNSHPELNHILFLLIFKVYFFKIEIAYILTMIIFCMHSCFVPCVLFNRTFVCNYDHYRSSTVKKFSQHLLWDSNFFDLFPVLFGNCFLALERWLLLLLQRENLQVWVDRYTVCRYTYTH